MEVNYEKTNEENNQPKVNVYEQQNDMKDLKEECNKGDKYKVHEISGAGILTKHDKSVCVISSFYSNRVRNKGLLWW